ncbi:hydrogenase subunit MbhD domain-containing protein [Dietzia natronolimnaea]|uniref:hydrogenase subunit MbhD domain-containing protein n=1 Tax=Dietzia natronolimnaea TaxID=161920 RepID=UPI003D0EFDCE
MNALGVEALSVEALGVEAGPIDAGVIDLVVGVAALVAAIVALTVRDRLTALVSFVLLGGLLALVWAGVRAPDVALAEAAIGTGVTGALLVDAVADRRRGAPPRFGRAGVAVWSVGALVGAGFAALLLRAVLTSNGPDRHPPLTETVAGAMDTTATGHPITAVLLDFRAYDTLLEVAVILVAVVGAFALAAVAPQATGTGGPGTGGPGVGGLGAGGPGAGGPSAGPLHRTLGDFLRLASPVLLLLAAWLLFAGAYRPGGAFQGGATVAGVLILATLAGIPPRILHGNRGRWLVAIGPTAFLAAGGLGLLLAGHWLAMPPGWESAATIGVETALTVSIGAGLTLLFLAVRRDTARIGDGGH